MVDIEDSEVEVRVEFCGEFYNVKPNASLVIGREGDIVIDDNPYLHRRFLVVEFSEGLWWLSNIGTNLSATVSDGDGRFQAWLAPMARLPLVFPLTTVWFSAGPTTYEIEISIGSPKFKPNPDHLFDFDSGSTTIGHVPLTHEQKLLLVALAELPLRGGRNRSGTIPTSAEAANKLGWTITKFNRKLDNVCQKLSNLGVGGLHGGSENLATNRRARLVEYALSARLIDANDLELLP